MLEDEADPARAGCVGHIALAERTAPLSGNSSPAMMRSSVVLPEPEGPSSATNSPSRDRQRNAVERRKAEKLFETCSTRIDMSVAMRRELVRDAAIRARS